MPPQVPDPQHQLGNGGGARIELEAEKLVRVDGVLAEAGQCFLTAEIEERHAKRQPVLVGTTSIEKSERLLARELTQAA